MSELQLKKSNTKRLIQGAFLLLILSAAYFQQQPQLKTHNQLDELVNNQTSDALIVLKAEVIKILADDNKGSRHQKFIVKSDLHTILIAHNIDLAARVPITVGDEVIISGEYEWNDQGGVIHWTHHDPQNRRAGGWIELNGKKFK